MQKNRKISWILTIAFIFSIIFSLPAVPVVAGCQDISGHWAEPQIESLMLQKIINGYPDNTFKPENPISRAEFIVITNKAFNFTSSTAINYSDVKPTDWFAVDIARAKAAGYISGYEDGTMKPNQQISRQEAASIVARILALKPADTTATLQRFSDNKTIANWSRDSIAAMVENGYLKGYPDNTFKAANSIKRAEAAVILTAVLSRQDGKAVEKPSEPEVQSLFDKAGTYGPETGTQVINEDVTISASGVTLQNLIIERDLIIAEEVGDGNVTLNNVTVKGKTYVRGGGKDSIHINGGQYSEIIIEQTATGQVRIVAVDTSGLRVTISENAKGEEIILNGDFKNVTVNADDVNITTQGETNIGELKVESGLKDVNIELAKDSNVKEIVLNSKTDVEGKGTIEKASGSKAKESSYATQPGSITTPSTSSGSGGGGGGGGGGDSTVAVSAISVKGIGDVDKITTDGSTLQMIATVSPSNASNKNVDWSVDKPEIAAINSSGLLTAVANGTVKVTATAKDGSGVKGTATITISGQTMVPVDKNIKSVGTIADINVANGTELALVGLPTTVEVTLDDNSTQNVTVTWDGGNPVYAKDKAGTYEFSGTLTLPANVTNTSNLTASVKVIVAEEVPVDKNIKSVATIADINVANGTELTSVGLPSTVEVTLDDNSTQNVTVTWDGGNPVYAKDKAGTYEFSGTLTLPANVTNTSNLTASVKVIVAEEVPVDKNIKSVATIADINVANGTELTSVGLPSTVEVTLDDNSIKNLAVTWDGGNPAYNKEAAGEYVFTGTLTLQANVTNTDNLTATVKVVVAEAIVDKYAVTFSVVGDNGSIKAEVDGTEINSGAEVEKGKNVVFTATPNAGYKVKEWKQNDGTLPGTDSTLPVTGLAFAINMTVEFVETAEKYMVTYSGNGDTGGTAPTDSTEYAANAEVTVADKGVLERTHYQFDGWNTKADGSGIAYAVGETFNITANTTLYAKWTPVVTKIEIKTPPTKTEYADGENLDLTGLEVTVTYAKGGTANIAFADFEANYLSTTFAHDQPVTKTEHQTLNVDWKGSTEVVANVAAYKVYYRVTFDAQGGTVSPESDLTKGNEAGNILGEGNLPTPIKDGFTFDGWFDAETSDNEVKADTQITDNMTIYARWTEVITTVPVTGVSLSKTTMNLTVGADETLGATVTPENATNKNVSWSSSNTNMATVDSDGKVAAVAVGNATITVTTEDGNFKATCTVTVEPAPVAPQITTEPTLLNGRVGTSYSQNLEATGTEPITWSIESGNLPDGLSLNGATISGIPTATGTFTFKVKAENTAGSNTKTITISVLEKAYNVTVINGTGNGDYAQGVKVNITADTPEEGKVFDKWESEDVVIPDSTKTETYFIMPAKDVTVKATYKAKEYTVTVSNDENGTGLATPATAGAGTEITLSSAPNSGYQFKEWEVIEGDISINENKFTMPAKDVKVKAIFEKIFVPVTGITGITETGTVNTEIDLSTATVDPTDATNQAITWSVASGEATLIGDKLTATAAGTVTVTATIINGIAVGTPYTQNFIIAITATPTEADSFEANLVDVNATVNQEVTQTDLEAGIKNLPTGATTNAEAFTPDTEGEITKDITITFSDGSTKKVTVKVKVERIKISNVVADAITTPVYGAPIVKPTFNVTEGSPAYFRVNDYNGWWQIKDGDTWISKSGAFTPGTWRFSCQVRIDDENAKTHKLEYPVKITVGENIWLLENAYPQSLENGGTMVNVHSSEYEVTEPILSDQDAPTGLTGVAPTTSANNDGKITGVNDTMEYRVKDTGDYVAVGATETEITGLAAGTYEVRLAAKEGYNASPATEVTVPEYEEPVIITANGSLLQAVAGTDFTGVLYTKNGKIYYNQVDNNGDWSGESEVAEVADGRLAIDSLGNPHVVYVIDGKIAYSKLDGGSWSDADLIVSNFEGICSNPDIAVDSNGKAHITYKDSMGDNAGSFSGQPDIMYASNISGSFSSQTEYEVAYSGFKSDYGYADFYSWDSKITVDGLDNYYILSQVREWDDSPNHAYSILAKSGSASGATDYESYYSTKSNHDIYDITSDGSKVVALYKGKGAIKTAELAVESDKVNFNSPTTLESAAAPHSVATNGTDIVVAEVSGSKLQIYYNGTLKNNIDIDVKAGTKVSVVHVDGEFYAVYTDNSSDIVKTIIN